MTAPPGMRFELLRRNGAARLGRLNFARGSVETPEVYGRNIAAIRAAAEAARMQDAA